MRTLCGLRDGGGEVCDVLTVPPDARGAPIQVAESGMKPDEIPRCRDCRHWVPHDWQPGVGRCDVVLMKPGWASNIETQSDFGCVKWQALEEPR